MKTKRISTPSAEGQLMLESLRQAVGKTLEKKRRLGQYAVTWKDGKPVIAGEDVPNTADNNPLQEMPH
jgi:hypothetical protein